MRIAITFRDQSKHEGRGNECGYTYLSGGEAESLPHVIEFETPALANHEYLYEFTRALLRRSLARWRVSFLAVLAFDAAEPEPNDNVS
jgi:hypothetical protein